MKGISAMIATVLLIAFTIAIGGIVSVWLTGLTTTQTQQVTNQSAMRIKCPNSLMIHLVKAPSTPPAAGWFSQVNITFANPSQQTISGLAVLIPTLSTGNSSVLSSTSLTAGLVGTAYANVSTIPTFVKISGLCNGFPVSATCENTQACWQTG